MLMWQYLSRFETHSTLFNFIGVPNLFDYKQQLVIIFWQILLLITIKGGLCTRAAYAQGQLTLFYQDPVRLSCYLEDEVDNEEC